MKSKIYITGAAGFGTTASNANSGRTLIDGNVYFPQVVGLSSIRFVKVSI